jgi:hypothetical protein
VLLGMPLAAAVSTLAGCGGAAGTPAAMPTSVPPRGPDPALHLYPRQAAVTTGQRLDVTAFTGDPSAIRWSVTPPGGLISPLVSASGQAVTFLAPRRPGRYTLTATTVADPPGPAAPPRSRSIPVAVTNLAGVYTYHDDLARDGANEREYALTPADVNAGNFGKLCSCPVDGAIYAQPLWVAHLEVDGERRNVVFVATAHDSLYAFDADQSPCVRLWKDNLIGRDHGSDGGESTIPAGADQRLVGKGDGDMTPEDGVTGTPVIDPKTDTIYLVSESVDYSLGLRFHARLHAIDLATGEERPGSPVSITATYTGDGGRTVRFDPRTENQRAGLALANGTVYVAFGSHEDREPFYGWILGYRYDGSSLKRISALNVAPDASEGGIWMSGAAPAVDGAGNLYVLTGNARFDAATADPPNDDYGDSLLKLSAALKILQYFTPSDQHFNDIENNDFGAGGAVLVNLPAASPVPHIAIGGGKDGDLFVVNRARLGGLGDAKALQMLGTGIETGLSGATPGLIFGDGAYWDDRYYVTGAGEPLKAYRLDPATDRLTFQAAASRPRAFGYPGATPAISSMGESNGIVWVLDDRTYCTPASQGCGPAVLRAYDARTLRELWRSPLSGPNAAGNAVKFTVPTIANGRVYIGTRGNNTGGLQGSSSISGELDVYGLEPR